MLAALACAVVAVERFRTSGSVPTTGAAWIWSARRTFNWSFALTLLATYAFLWLVTSVYRGRKRLVIPAATNHAGESFTDFAAGLSVDLANHLGRLSELYRTIDEANSRYDSGSTSADFRSGLGPGVGVDNTGAQLADVVGEKSSVKLGPLDLPLRPLVAGVQRLALRNRLSLTLQKEGPYLTLLADQSGARGSWRVERLIAEDATPRAIADDLRAIKEEMAHRIFAVLAPNGTANWRALEQFSDGLRAYRRTLSTNMQRDVNLNEAEQYFLAALGSDKGFARCSYNLGVVYRSRDDRVAAEAAFTRAISDNPRHADAAYALSEIFYSDGRFGRALDLADRAIVHAKDNISALNMKGFLLAHAATAQTTPEHRETIDALRRCLPYFRSAVALGWRDLLRAILKGGAIDAAERVLALPLINLAATHARLGEPAAAERILGQAISLAPSANLYFVLGNICLNRTSDAARWRAARAYDLAILFAQTDAERASYRLALTTALASIQSQTAKPKPPRVLAESAFEKALSSPSILEPEALKRLADVWTKVQDTQRSRDATALAKAIRSINTTDVGGNRMTRLLRELGDLRLERRRNPDGMSAEVRGWTAAMYEIEIGVLLATAGGPADLARSARRLKFGVACLEKFNPSEARLAFANERLAESLRLRQRFSDALTFADKAVSMDPFSAVATRQRGITLAGMFDYDRSERDLQRSFALSPPDFSTLELIGQMPWSRGINLTNRTAQKAEYNKVIATFTEAAIIAPSEDARGKMYFWLGRFHGELADYDKAADNFAKALGRNVFPMECSWFRGQMLMEQELYDLAEDQFSKALKAIADMRRNGGPFTSRGVWLAAPRTTSSGSLPPSHFWIGICLQLALLFAERGRDLARAERRLRYIDRHRHLISAAAPGADEFAREACSISRLGLIARLEDYSGWIAHLRGDSREGRRRLETSIKMKVDAESLYHLARLCADRLDPKAATHYCRQARTVDTRGVWADRLARLETELASRA